MAAADQRDRVRAPGCPHMAAADHSVTCVRLAPCRLKVANTECTSPARQWGGQAPSCLEEGSRLSTPHWHGEPWKGNGGWQVKGGGSLEPSPEHLSNLRGTFQQARAGGMRAGEGHSPCSDASLSQLPLGRGQCQPPLPVLLDRSVGCHPGSEHSSHSPKSPPHGDSGREHTHTHTHAHAQREGLCKSPVP